MIITIDGPAGAGKTTVSKQLASHLGYRYLDTGALYRGVAKAAQNACVAPDDDQALEDLCASITLEFVETSEGQRLMLDHRDITDDIRTPQISMLASAVSARSVVRKFLLDTQRRIGLKKNIVVEGRDMGTVVFPDADVKFFLDAAVHTRARRRYLELQENDATSSDLESVERDMMRRDNNDANRTIAPLRAAADAIVIDSTKLNVEQVIQIMLDHITA